MPPTTEFRNHPLVNYKWNWTQAGFKNTDYHGSGTASLQTGSQTTTSYRTGRRAAAEAGPGEYVSTSGSQIDFARQLYVEAEGDGSLLSGELGRSPTDTGHEFETVNTSTLWPPKVTLEVMSSPQGHMFCEAPILMPCYAPGTYPTLIAPSSNQIDIDGTRLMSMCLPTKPEAQLAQFLGELRERLPQVPGQLLAQAKSAKSLGGEYLNVEFGIKPFRSDLQKFARSVLDAASIVRQFQRDAGRVVRRGAELSGSSHYERVGSQDNGDLNMPIFWNLQPYSWFYANRPPCVIEDSFHSETWFTGAFQYYLNDAHHFLGRLGNWERLANRLLGTDLTASVIWELTPWSWLVDWHSDIGTFFSNVDAFSEDKLVLRYGYVMHKQSATRIESVTGLIRQPGVTYAPTSVVTYKSASRKRRTRATPYGFGVDAQNLSPVRLAILAALGLTKSPGGNYKFLN